MNPHNTNLTDKLIQELRRIRRPPLPHPPRVLIVEDEESVRVSMRLVLQDLGCEVVEDDGGRVDEGMLTGESTKPDIVFLDLRLQGMRGVDVLRTIRRYDSSIPVVIVTGFPDSNQIIEATELGYIGLIKKPFTTSSLAEVLKKHNLPNRKTQYEENS